MLERLFKRRSIDRVLQGFTPKALILDFDGVFTDNKVIVTADGAESAICDRSDGFAIQSLQRRGFPILVLSTEKVPIVKARSQKLGLSCIHGASDKAAILRQWFNEPVAVADAFPEARTVARVVLSARGGNGAVREIAMAITKSLDSHR